MKVLSPLIVALAFVNVSAQSSMSGSVGIMTTSGSVGGDMVTTVGARGSGTGSLASVGFAGSMASSGSIEMDGDVGLSDSGSENVGSSEDGSEDYSIDSDPTSSESESDSATMDSQASAASMGDDSAGISVRSSAFWASAASAVAAATIFALL